MFTVNTFLSTVISGKCFLVEITSQQWVKVSEKLWAGQKSNLTHSLNKRLDLKLKQNTIFFLTLILVLFLPKPDLTGDFSLLHVSPPQ